MTDYTRMIEALSDNSAHTGAELSDVDPKLLLNTQTRIISPEQGFITTIGTTNEVNSNIITIQCGRFADGHDLYHCKHKILKWSVVGGEKGSNVLEATEGEEDTILLKWLVPPEAYVAAGDIKIAISYYDTDDNDNVIYRWNSVPYSGLKIAKGLDEVSLTDFTTDEIVYVDLPTRKIIVPAGMNTRLGMKGEHGFSTIKFRCNRFYRGRDFLEAIITITFRNANNDGIVFAGSSNLIPGIGNSEAPEKNSDLIEFYWNTESAFFGAGPLEFGITMAFYKPTVSIWKSETCSVFTVGEFINDNGTDTPTNDNNELYIADAQALNTELNEMFGTDYTTDVNAFTTTEAIMYTLNSLFDAGVIFHSDGASEMYPD